MLHSDSFETGGNLYQLADDQITRLPDDQTTGHEGGPQIGKKVQKIPGGWKTVVAVASLVA